MRTRRNIFSKRRATLLVAGVISAAAVSVGALADDVINDLDGTIDVTAEVMTLNVDGPNGATVISVKPNNVDPTFVDTDSGCNFDNNKDGAPEALVMNVKSSNPAVATAAQASISYTKTGCNDQLPLTIRPHAQGSTTFTLEITSNTTGGAFDLRNATFVVNVAPKVVLNAAPQISVLGVDDGASYPKGSVPAATCKVTDAEDGAKSFAATIDSSALVAGLGLEKASCSYTDAGGLVAASSKTYSIVDNTPPVIVPTVGGTLGLGDWYVTAVPVTWSVTDAQSSISSSSGCADTSVTSDTSGQTITCTATSAGGNNSASVTVKRDATKPIITAASRTPAANDDGWNSGPVTVSFDCSDATSGLNGGCPDVTKSGEGGGQSATQTATDNAGNSDSASVNGINIDATKPEAALTLARSADQHGWYNAPVGYSTDGTDDLSGIDSCDADGEYAGADGTDIPLSGSCTDKAGNSGSAGASIDYDDTDPTIVASRTPAGANAAGWNNTPVTVSFKCGDETSGIADDACPAPKEIDDGADQEAGASVSDVAGNSASDKVTGVNVDTAAPSVETTLDDEANGAGWFNTRPDWSSTGDDGGGSGIDTCDTGTYAGDDEAAATVTGKCRDLAGNEGSGTSEPFNYDGTDPVAEVTLARAPDHDGWYNAPVGYSTGGDDNLSGIESCDADGEFDGPDGTGRTVTGSCTDVAGNSDSGTSAAFDYDNTNPTISASRVPAEGNAVGWNNEPVVVSFDCDDATSGIADGACPDDVTLDDGDEGASDSVKDRAGNSSNTASVTGVKVDTIDPSVVTSLDAAPNAAGWFKTKPAWSSRAADDAGSDIAGCDSGTYDGGDSAAATVSGSCSDEAGNTAGDTSDAFKYDGTAPTVACGSVVPTFQIGTTGAQVSGTVTDALSGASNASVSSLANTSTIGSGKTIRLEGSDNAGNTASTTCTYNVVYAFDGFYQPVDMGGVFNRAKAGSAIPVKFSLDGAPRPGSNTPGAGSKSVISSFRTVKVACPSAAVVDEVESLVVASTSSLKYDATADQWVYVWKTPTTLGGSCHRLEVGLADGTTKTANFNMTR